MASALWSLGAAAQSVTVVNDDGTTHKFGADYVAGMTFEEVTSGYDIMVTDLDVDVYSSGNVGFHLSLSNGGKLDLDTYGPKTTQYLRAGTYEVTSNSPTGEFYIDPSPSWTYYMIDGAKKAVASGKLVITNKQEIYTLVLDMVMDDGTELKTQWSGKFPRTHYSEYFEMDMSSASYNENPQDAGHFYVKFNDSNYYVEMPLIFNCGSDATELLPGTYTVSKSDEAMTLKNSYISIYSPSSSPEINDGVVLVEKLDDGYFIDMQFLFDDGRHANFVYEGAITGTPTFNTESKAPAMKHPAAGFPFMKFK